MPAGGGWLVLVLGGVSGGLFGSQEVGIHPRPPTALGNKTLTDCLSPIEQDT